MLHYAGESLFFYLPVIVCNLSVHTLWLRFGISSPVDLGLMLREQRLIGDSRGIDGLIYWLICSVSVAALQGRALDGIYLGCGGFAGTLFSSFIKRRIGLTRGVWCPVLDETDFIIGSTLFYISYQPLALTTFLAGFLLMLVAHKLVNLFIRPIWEKGISTRS